MKKIFYFIASAIVALGAVACQNDIDENIDNNQQTEGYSIKVTIDEQTRVALGDFEEGKGYKLSFEEGDVLVVRSGWQDGTNYLFEYAKTEGDVYTFTCEAEGVNSLVGTNPHIFYLGGLHKSADDLTHFGTICNTAAENISGIGMYYDAANPTDEYKFGDEEYKVTLQTLPLLKFTANEPVTFKSTNPSQFFVDNVWNDSYTTKETGEIYLPIMPSSGGEATITVTTESGFENSFTKKLQENVIYNLGTIEVEEVVETTTVYLEPDWWTSDDANFYAYYWDNKGNSNVKMTDEDKDGIYECDLPNTTTGLIFVRLNPAYNSFGWNDSTITNRVWNQTADLTLPEGNKNHYYIKYDCWEAAGYVPTITHKIYAYNNAKWAKMNIWAWNTDTSANYTGGSWPGKAMTTETVSGHTYYVYEMPATATGKNVSVIFNNGSAQTPDFNLGTFDGDVYLRVDASGAPIILDDPANPSQEVEKVARTITVTYTGGGDLNIYWWGATGAPSWPGIKMTKSGNTYTYSFSKELDGASVSVIFNNGSKQTADITGVALNKDHAFTLKTDFSYTWTTK